MSKLQDLIQELCPNGVEYKKLGDVCNIKRGERVTKSSVSKEGTYPVISGGITPMGYLEKYNRDANTITVAQYGTAGYVAWQDTEFWANDICYSLFPIEVLNKRFLYYILKNQSEIIDKMVNRDAVPFHLPQIKLASLLIPIPPLPVQEEIVKILDRFAVYTAELQAELQARKEQYEYYRNLLLNFNHAYGAADEQQKKSVTTLGGHSYEIQWKTLGEIGEICMCKRILKNQTNTTNGIPFYKIGTFGKKSDAYISKELYIEYKSRYSFPKKGEILISASGTIGRTVIYDGNDAYFQDSNIVWISNSEEIVLNKYLYHYYKIVEWYVEGGTIKRLYNTNISKTRIPIPPLELQERIVAILDKFETLVNDLSQGLPAEIAAVQEQYEYYRNKLLTFKQVA